MVEKLVEASRLLDDVYWRQSDLAGLALYKSTTDTELKRLLMIMGSRWDLLDENRRSSASEPMPPGHELYPQRPDARRDREVRRSSIPPTKAAIYDPYTVVKRAGRPADRDAVPRRSTRRSSSRWRRRCARPRR